MRRKIVNDLIENLVQLYGREYVPYGTSEEEIEGTGFRVTSIPATFSVLSYGDIPTDTLDYHIESYPPGEYLSAGQAGLNEFLGLIEKYRRPIDEWPEGGFMG